MEPFRNFSIGRKLTLITMLISGIALLLACITFVVYEQVVFRRTLVRDFAVLADMFDDNVASGLAFNDVASLKQTLATLSADPQIVAACVYGTSGEVVADYQRPGLRDFTFPPARATGQVFGSDRLDTFKDIVLTGETIGVVYIGTDLAELRARAWRYTAIIALLLLGCLGVVLFLSSWLQRFVSRPITDLARTVHAVAVNQNYAVRAVKTTGDEIGQLIDGFNNMLAQIQERDADLQRAHDSLEKRVADRTGELAREQMRFRTIFESVPVGISLFTQEKGGEPDRLINDAHLRICGITREQQQQDNGIFQRLSHPADYAQQEIFHRQLATGIIDRFSFEKRYLRPDGRTVWVAFSVISRNLPDGSLQKLTTVVDITDLKRAQEEVAVERARFKFIFDSVPVGISLLVPGTHETRVANPAHERMTGISAGSQREPGIFDRATHPDDLPGQRVLLNEFRAGRIDRFSLEKRYVHADGSIVWVNLTRRRFVDPATHEEQSISTIVDITERKEAEARLASSLSVLHATLEATADGILVVDAAGRPINFNRKFAEMWRIPSSALDAGRETGAVDRLVAPVKDPAAFERAIQAGSTDPEADSSDVVEFDDGRVFERRSQPHRIDGGIVGRVWSFRDITERRQAERRLADTHKQLLDTSRQAGMAEVATGVLHNVGNVLNSVNVSTTLLADLVRQSKSDRVARLSELLTSQEKDLGAFFASDPRGRQVPGFLQSLTAHLAREKEDLLKELDSLRKNVEHIKEIVAMQQNYAKVSGVSETVAVVDLIEDALRMNAGGLARHDVTITRDFRARPVVTVEKHKVLQTLVNLMRNAKHACDEAGHSHKEMIIRVSVEQSRVKIAVVDNGIGIPPENLTRIFAHGFTTRKQGHGFGLHSGALAAKELGGSLVAHSDGPGRGATFTRELPYSPNLTPS